MIVLNSGGCYLIIGKPGHGYHWQYIGEEERGSHSIPGSSRPLQQEVPGLAGAREIANAREVTRRLRAMSEQIAEVIDADEEVVELRPGDRRPRWLTVLMRRGGQ